MALDARAGSASVTGGGSVHVNVTDHPTAAWTAQQLVEACPDDTTPRWLLRDRDAIYGDVFQRRVAGSGIGEVVSSPFSHGTTHT